VADSIDIKVPDLGDFADVEVIEVLVKAGDRIAREDGLITLETDKATKYRAATLSVAWPLRSVTRSW